jgi:hypothetical protein
MAPKPQDLYDNQKKDMSTNDGGTKIWSFPLHCGLIDVVIKIYSNYVMSKENINFRKRKKSEGWHWTLNKSIMTIETNSHIRALIDKQILAFVAINTHAIVCHLMNQMFCVCICN